jgi:hypothetical protein
MSEESRAKETPESVQRVSSYSLAVIFGTLILAFICLALALLTYSSKVGITTTGVVFLVIGFAGLISATYMLIQARGHMVHIKIEIPPVMTTVACQKCGFKNVRTFERGDYVFKQAGPCPKCNDKLLVSAIYREVKEKPKKEMF